MGFTKQKQEWVIYEGMTSLKRTFASAVVIECTFPVCAVLHFSPQPGMPGCLCVPSYNLKLRCQKPLKLSYLGKARIEWREKRGRKRAKGGQRWNKLLARIGRQKQDKKEEERQTWEGKGRWGWMERFGRMAWKGERQVGEGEGGKYVTKRVWNTMESLKSKDRDEEERRRGGIWWGSKEMRWEKVEGWRDLGWMDQVLWIALPFRSRLLGSHVTKWISWFTGLLHLDKQDKHANNAQPIKWWVHSVLNAWTIEEEEEAMKEETTGLGKGGEIGWWTVVRGGFYDKKKNEQRQKTDETKCGEKV